MATTGMQQEKKTAVAVTNCTAGRSLIKINSCPIELVQPEILRYKAFEPILLLGRSRILLLGRSRWAPTVCKTRRQGHLARDRENSLSGGSALATKNSDLAAAKNREPTGRKEQQQKRGEEQRRSPHH
ncbi:40S ribosomal protein S16 [Nymphaea thermarum]|nr:40S ribosomal protein S16 [Nymphaea thermarum]